MFSPIDWTQVPSNSIIGPGDLLQNIGRLRSIHVVVVDSARHPVLRYPGTYAIRSARWSPSRDPRIHLPSMK
jgi:hypothetical protein